MNNLALLLKDKGDYEQAESLLRQALEISENILGSEHPDTIACRASLEDLLVDGSND
ncbi:tetratricopeptide repeat protein [Candidatus Halobeggiatoa sp. HSG11]|nr:tetratricopeptide repeat protein [Candidatus Halobeggiatoa sp. HSG11]